MKTGKTLAMLAVLGTGLMLAYHGVGVGEEQAESEVANAVGGGYLPYPNPRGMAVFSHLSHADAGFTCEECHDAIFPKKRGSFKMKDLYAGKACGKCHDGEMAAPKKPEAAAFPVGMCNGCHMPTKAFTYTPKGLGPVQFPHPKHTAEGTEVEAGYACGACHPKPFPRKSGQIKMAVPHTTLCATCHDGKTVSPSGETAPDIKKCAVCHKKPGAQETK